MIEDADFDGLFCWPPNEGFSFYARMYPHVLELRGGDPASGRKLYDYFLDARIPSPQVRLAQGFDSAGDTKMLALATLEATAEPIVAAGLASEDEVRAAVDSLSAYAGDATTVIGDPRVFQIWAMRQAHDGHLGGCTAQPMSVASAVNVNAREDEMAATETAWQIHGEYFENCNCDVVCPCLFSPLAPMTSSPTQGACEVAFGFHVDDGSFGDVSLDGLNVALVARTPGPMAEGNWQVALYVDDEADEEQSGALQAIFTGSAGGVMANLAPLIGECSACALPRSRWHKDGQGRSIRSTA